MAQEESSLAGAVGEALSEGRQTLAVAESLTGGELSARFATAEGASAWFRGGVVAYASDVKHEVLRVPEGPVVSEVAVTAMAENVARVLHADVAVAVSGVAGPDPQDDQPPGTVWMGAHVGDRTSTRLEHFAGEPPEVVDATIECVTAWLLELLRADA